MCKYNVSWWFCVAGVMLWHEGQVLVLFRKRCGPWQSCSATLVLHYEYMISPSWEGDEATQLTINKQHVEAFVAAAAALFCHSTLLCSSHLLSHRASRPFWRSPAGSNLNGLANGAMQMFHSSIRRKVVLFIHGRDFGAVHRKDSSLGSWPSGQNSSSELVWYCHVKPSTHMRFLRGLPCFC